LEIVKEDETCSRCGDNYFSKNATEKMKKHNLCWHCIAEHSRKGTGTLESFAQGVREVSHYKI
jgi:hypothetical protein